MDKVAEIVAEREAWKLFPGEECDHPTADAICLLCAAAVVRVLQANAESSRDAAKRLKAGIYMPWAEAGGKPECIHGCNLGIPCRECDWLLLLEGKPRSMLVKPGHEETPT